MDYKNVFEELFAPLLGGGRAARNRRYYLKSLLLLSMIVVLFADHYFKIADDIRTLFGETKISHITLALEIVSYCLVALFIIASALTAAFWGLTRVFTALNDVKTNNSASMMEDTFRCVYYGSFNRAKDAIDWLLIGAIPLYIFDETYLLSWLDNMSPVVFVIIVVIAALRFSTSSFIGVINRFFRLQVSENDIKNEDDK